MRRPTSLEERWAWWESQFTEAPLSAPLAEPQCGFYKTRKFRWGEWSSQNAPWLPARIFVMPAETDEAGELLEDEIWIAEVGDRRFNPWLNESWMYWRPIMEAEWKWLKALAPLTAKKIPSR